MAYPNPRLIKALKGAADQIERQPKTYKWTDMFSCNCGIVAQHLGIFDTASAEHTAEIYNVGTWASAGNQIAKCLQTGQPISAVFQDLLVAGLEPQDLRNLERLWDFEVVNRLASTDDLRLDNPVSVIQYLRAWADLLEEQMIGTAAISAAVANSHRSYFLCASQRTSTATSAERC